MHKFEIAHLKASNQPQQVAKARHCDLRDEKILVVWSNLRRERDCSRRARLHSLSKLQKTIKKLTFTIPEHFSPSSSCSASIVRLYRRAKSLRSPEIVAHACNRQNLHISSNNKQAAFYASSRPPFKLIIKIGVISSLMRGSKWPPRKPSETPVS